MSPVSVAVSMLVADAATSALTYLGTLVAGILTGAVGGAVITASHERSERSRDRMMQASTDFLAAVEEVNNAQAELTRFIIGAVHEKMVLKSPEDFPEVVAGAISRQAMREKIQAEVFPKTRKLDAARRRLAIVFPRDATVVHHALRVNRTFHDDINLLLPVELGLTEFTAATDKHNEERDAALDEFTAAAHRAMTRWRL